MILDLIIVIILVGLAGTYAGLTLALFSLKLTLLKTKLRTGDKDAEKVYNIRKRGNLLLCTLLLGNVASYTAMTIFLGSITTSITAGFIATSLIFLFGEILPQAAFPRFAITLGARLYWFVWVTMILFYPVCAPIAWILDKILGKETPMLWSKEELGELVSLHENTGDGVIDKDEERIVLGALSFSEMQVADVMIPKGKIFYIGQDKVIDQSILQEIKHKGFSRIPVCDTSTGRVAGILYAKNLLGVSPGLKVLALCNRSGLILISKKYKLDKLLNLFIKQKAQMALVVDPEEVLLGIVTLEDIVEEILKTEIEDKKA